MTSCLDSTFTIGIISRVLKSGSIGCVRPVVSSRAYVAETEGGERGKTVYHFEDDDLGRGEGLPIFALPKLTNKTQNN